MVLHGGGLVSKRVQLPQEPFIDPGLNGAVLLVNPVDFIIGDRDMTREVRDPGGNVLGPVVIDEVRMLWVEWNPPDGMTRVVRGPGVNVGPLVGPGS